MTISPAVIRAVASAGTGVVHIVDSNGGRFEGRACDLSGKLPAVGDLVSDWAGLRPLAEPAPAASVGVSRYPGFVREGDTTPADTTPVRSVSVAGGWQSENAAGELFGPVFNSANDLWGWQAGHKAVRAAREAESAADAALAVLAERRARILAAYRHHRKALFYGVRSASQALAMARADVDAGRIRYAPDRQPNGRPWPVMGAMHDGARCVLPDDIADAGFRMVGTVDSDGRWREAGGYRAGGYLTDPDGDVARDGSGLCWGVVVQLPSRKGKVRLLAGHQHGGVSGGPVLEMRVFETAPDTYSSDIDAVRDSVAGVAARMAADGLAEASAEKERDYQTAWRAGSDFANAIELARTTGAAVRSILAELRAEPTLRAAVRDRSTIIGESIRADIERKLAERQKAYADAWSLADDNGAEAGFIESAGRRAGAHYWA